MNFIEQSWFWAGAFPVISAGIAIYLKEFINRKTKIKLEKIKLFDKEKFNAYLEVYDFISLAFGYYWPPDKPREDFINLMKNHFFKKVRKHYPYLSNEIRVKLKVIENQYKFIGDPDIHPEIPFEQFYRNEFPFLLSEIEILVEKAFDDWSLR